MHSTLDSIDTVVIGPDGTVSLIRTDDRNAADILLEAIENSGVDIPPHVMDMLRIFLPVMPEDIVAGYISSAHAAMAARAAGDEDTAQAIIAEKRQIAEQAGLGEIFDSLMAGV